MASALQKLLRKVPSPPTRFITSFHPSSQPPNLLNPIIHLHLQSHHLIPPCEVSHQPNASTIIFPSFPFGFSSKPFFDTGFSSKSIFDTGFSSKPSFDSGFCSPVVEEEEEGLEDSRTIWADSVKKKRKKKMNKHKYQKLRKRMRRQT